MGSEKCTQHNEQAVIWLEAHLFGAPILQTALPSPRLKLAHRSGAAVSFSWVKMVFGMELQTLYNAHYGTVHITCFRQYIFSRDYCGCHKTAVATQSSLFYEGVVSLISLVHLHLKDNMANIVLSRYAFGPSNDVWFDIIGLSITWSGTDEASAVHQNQWLADV